MPLKELHILNGDALVHGFLKQFPNKSYLVWREALCQGPLQYDLDDSYFEEKRKSFLKSSFNATIEKHLTAELQKIELASVSEVILWFEYDLFCQVNRMAAISWLVQNNFKGKISVLNIDKFQTKEFTGLGQINHNSYPEIYHKRVPLSPRSISYMDAMWHKIADGDLHLLPFLKELPELRYFNFALRTIAVYSNTHGLGAALLESRIYTLLKTNPLDKKTVIGSMLQNNHDLGYGDVQIENVLDQLIDQGNILILDNVLSLKE